MEPTRVRLGTVGAAVKCTARIGETLRVDRDADRAAFSAASKIAMDTIGDLVKERDGWKEAAKVYLGEFHRRDVGDALLEFFTDLSIIARKKPAPCPWCGNSNTYVCQQTFGACDACGSHGPIEEYKHVVRAWNRVAVPMAFRRLAITERVLKGGAM